MEHTSNINRYQTTIKELNDDVSLINENIRKEKLALKDKIAQREKIENWDIQDSGIDFYE